MSCVLALSRCDARLRLEVIDANQRRIMTGMEDNGRASENLSMIEIAQMMANAGSGSAFDGASMAIGDVRSLVSRQAEAAQKDEAAATEQGAGDGDGAQEDAAAGETGGGKRTWFNRDHVVAVAVRKAHAWSESYKKQVSERVAKVQRPPVDAQTAL